MPPPPPDPPSDEPPHSAHCAPGLPSGDDAAELCSRAIIGRGRVAIENPTYEVEDNGCRRLLGQEYTEAGPVAGGDADDVTDLGIRNLAGNMAEWVADAQQSYRAPCWNPGPIVLVDPTCGASPMDDLSPRSVRGASWAVEPFATSVFCRGAQPQGSETALVGFRCVADMP